MRLDVFKSLSVNVGRISIKDFLGPVRFEAWFSRQGSKSHIVRFENVSFLIDIDKIPQIRSIKIVRFVIDIDKIP
jgi:hypothetical protein